MGRKLGGSMRIRYYASDFDILGADKSSFQGRSRRHGFVLHLWMLANLTHHHASTFVCD